MRFLAALALLIGLLLLRRRIYRYRHTWWGSELVRTYGVKPRRRFHPITRADFLRTSMYAVIAASVCLILAVLGFTAGERFEADSALARAGLMYGFVFFVLAAMAVVGSIVLLVKAALWRPPDPLPYAVECHGSVIGHSALEHRNPVSGVAWGIFHPAPAYETVYAVFRLYADAQGGKPGDPPDPALLEHYERERQALGLELRGPDGRLLATQFIHVGDYSVDGGLDAFILHVVQAGSSLAVEIPR